MTHDYCVVGPTFVLYGQPDESRPDVLAMRAEERPGRRVARLRATLRHDAVRIAEPESVDPLSGQEVAELIQLFVRVCADFWSYRFPLDVHLDDSAEAVVRDGLSSDGFTTLDGTVWRRPPVPFTRTPPKARSMEEVYQDLLSVPWNFVPREWDVFDRLIVEARTTSLSVLDLGCGVGKNVGPLEDRGFAVYGVDPAHGAVRRCRAIVGRPDRFVVGTAARLPWRSDCFDRVLDVGALHCMETEERRQAVREVARVLTPGGLLYSRFFTPRPSRWLEMQPMAVDRFGLCVDEVRTLLAGPLVCQSIIEQGPVVYATAVKPPA